MSAYKIEASTGQHLGDREEQQDRVGLFTSLRAAGHMLAVVADGMGGKSGGALAAEQVVRTAQQVFEQFSPQFETAEKILNTIASEAHLIIKLTALSAEKEPHSTMAALLITPEGSAVWAHVGDSRVYRFTGPNCADRTIDHSYVEKLVRDGKLTPEQAKNHRLSNVLMNALGSTDVDPYVNISRYNGLKAGDAFLLCSDGLWHYFSDAELGAAIAMNSPRQGSEMLIKKVRERAAGTAADNCTIAIIKLVTPPIEEKNYTAQKMRRAV